MNKYILGIDGMRCGMCEMHVEETIPEMTSEGHDHFGVWSFIAGFVIMLLLDCIQFQSKVIKVISNIPLASLLSLNSTAKERSGAT